MTIFHLSVECFPVAKVGGLADVVGALPKYLNRMEDVEAAVVMPWYSRPFVYEHSFDLVFQTEIFQNDQRFGVEVYRQNPATLGFDLYLIKIPGLLDRENPYGYWDQSQQFLAFQQAALVWLTQAGIRPDVLHCHDYHTGLAPFFLRHCPEFEPLNIVPVLATIHNGEYQGEMDWSMLNYFPWIREDADLRILDWDGKINPLATMIKTADAVSTVSNGYLQELKASFHGLEGLIRQESPKEYGLLNGIDTEVWDPATDVFLNHHYSGENFPYQKWQNKLEICQEYHLNPDLPLISFIGRFAREKGADLLPKAIRQIIRETEGGVNVMVLGSGDIGLEHDLAALNQEFVNLGLELGYREPLSHKIYAASDFLIMPSRVEPCGLNQMYAMRYGTIPVVRHTGGLKDTVQDLSVGGSGLTFNEATAADLVQAMHRARALYHQPEYLLALKKSNMGFDFSWEHSAKNYVNLYSQLVR